MKSSTRKKAGRRGWGGEELDERKRFGLFTFWFGILDVEKQKKVEKQILESNKFLLGI